MHTTLYHNLPRPFFVLAPMEDVTDMVFRSLVKKNNFGRPDLLVTEFTNCDGICSVGQSRVIHRLRFDKEYESPIIAQIWGKTPQNYYETAKLCCELGFDGIDINMGCPEKNVIKVGACSALINNQPLAKEIINSVQKAVAEFELDKNTDKKQKVAVSVKSRIGFGNIATHDWYGFLIQQNLDAITVHGRTVKDDELPANWDEIAKVVEIRDNYYNSQKVELEKKLKQEWLELIC